MQLLKHAARSPPTSTQGDDLKLTDMRCAAAFCCSFWGGPRRYGARAAAAVAGTRGQRGTASGAGVERAGPFHSAVAAASCRAAPRIPASAAVAGCRCCSSHLAPALRQVLLRPCSERRRAVARSQVAALRLAHIISVGSALSSDAGVVCIPLLMQRLLSSTQANSYALSSQMTPVTFACRRIAALPPQYIGDIDNCLVVCAKDADLTKIAEDSSALILRCSGTTEVRPGNGCVLDVHAAAIWSASSSIYILWSNIDCGAAVTSTGHGVHAH